LNNVKATGIVRRIDDLGRVVIPKEIRRTMRIREGDPLEIYTSREGEVIFKKYSLLGGVEEFAAQICETLNKSTGMIAAVTDRDTFVAVAGSGRRDLLGKRISPDLEQILEGRKIYQHTADDPCLPVVDGGGRLSAAVAAPILSEGDLLGLLVLIGQEPMPPTGDTEYKLAQTIAAFLGRHMEN
jgi:AbrB family transcriptional regulator (stage V sporulation protein T)